MNKQNRYKAVLAISGVLLLVVIFLQINMTTRFLTYSNKTIEDKLNANIVNLNNYLDRNKAYSINAATYMSHNPDVLNAIRNKDTKETLRLFNTALDVFHINYFTITDYEGNVIARTHEPDNFGDSIAKQINVINALNGEVSSFFEPGVYVRVSVRTGAPVYDTDGSIIGVIIAGVRFDSQEVVEELSQLFNSEVSIFFGDIRIATTLIHNKELAIGTALSPDVAKVLFEDKMEYTGEKQIFDTEYIVHYKPIINSKGEAFAAIFIGISSEELRAEVNIILLQIIFISIAGIIIISILTFSMVKLRRTEQLIENQLTELNQMYEEEKKLMADLEAANKAKSEFLATMSHEIRTPLNAILGIADIQIMDDTLSSNTKDALRKIYSSGDMLLGIINDILDLSKIESGKLELVTGVYEMASLISDTAQINMMRIGSKPIEFELQISEETPSALSGDELRIKQILNNVLSNAFKYTREGTVKLSVNIEDSGDDSTVIMVFSVKDTGQGMTKEQIDKLFDEYTRFNTEANRTTEGIGLGMNITRNLIDMMKGNISVESEPGKGSVFTIRLPQGKVGTSVLGPDMVDNLHKFRTSFYSQTKRSHIIRDPMPYGSVLIVDDVETNIYVAKGLLTPYKLKIDSVESGFDAIDRVKAGNIYDIIFMDHMMPKMDGIEATQKIRSMGYEYPIVALSANAVVGQEDVFLNNGFNDFISKPIDIRQLNLVLNKLVRDKQPREVILEARKQAELDNKQSALNNKQVHDIIYNELFLRDANKTLNALKVIMDIGGPRNEEDMKTFIIHTHGIKTALINIGEGEISSVALNLEKMGHAGDIDGILSITPDFIKSLEELIKEMTPDEVYSNEVIVDDVNFLLEGLNGIVIACDSYDERTAEKLIFELIEKKWSKPIKNKLKNLQDLLFLSEFDSAAQTAREYQKDIGN